MRATDKRIAQIETIIKHELGAWPKEWVRFTWPGYTYEHTLRVRNLALHLADRLAANARVVELTALLHDLGKPAGEPHAEPSAERADAVLADLGVDLLTRQRVHHIIAHHIDVDPLHPLENRIIYDADLIDANYGDVAFTRYITIRSHRGRPIEAMVDEAPDWLERNRNRLAQVLTLAGREIAQGRFQRMQRFYSQLCHDLDHQDLDRGSGPALYIARFLNADAKRPSLYHQWQAMKEQAAEAEDQLTGSVFYQTFVQDLGLEITGQQ